MRDRIGDIYDIAERFSVRGNKANGLDAELVWDSGTGDWLGCASVHGNAHQAGSSGAIDVVRPLAIGGTDGIGIEASGGQLLGRGAVGAGTPDGDFCGTSVKPPGKEQVAAGAGGKAKNKGIRVGDQRGGVMPIWIHARDACRIGNEQFLIESPVEFAGIGDLRKRLRFRRTLGGDAAVENG